MRKIFVLFVIAIALAISAMGLVAGSTSSPHRSRVGSPNFVCISTPFNLGICIGPPTKQG